MDNLKDTHRVIASQLASWRYFLLMALPPLAVALFCTIPWIRFSLGFLLMLLGYYCWRMFLDERLFTLLAGGVDISAVDRSMALLWKRAVSEQREWDARIQGTGRLLRGAGILLLVLWIISLAAVWFEKQ